MIIIHIHYNVYHVIHYNTWEYVALGRKPAKNPGNFIILQYIFSFILTTPRQTEWFIGFIKFFHNDNYLTQQKLRNAEHDITGIVYLVNT